MKSNVYKLGEFLALVDNRNTDLAITNLQGVSISKEFMPSIANIVGTDLSSYKIVRTGQFAYGPVTSRNGDKISIARLTSDDCIISSSYTPFEVTRPDFLCPEYLMLWFMRPEFDRYARYMSNGSAREVFDWDCICNVDIPVPPIEEQRKIVRQYKVVTERIVILNSLDSCLLNYGKSFVGNIYQDEKLFAPEKITIKDYCAKIVSGGTPSRTELSYWDSNDIAWLKNGEIKNNIIVGTDEFISQTGLNNSSAKLLPENTVSMAMYCVSSVQLSLSCIPIATNQACLNMVTNSEREASILYYILSEFGGEIISHANGSAQQNLSSEIISSFEFKRPNIASKEFDCLEKNIHLRKAIAFELSHLMKLKNNIISTMWRG